MPDNNQQRMDLDNEAQIISDRQIDAYCNLKTYDLGPRGLNTLQDIGNAGRNPVTVDYGGLTVLKIDFPDRFNSILKQSAVSAAKLICATDNLKEKLQVLKRHRTNQTWPDDIIRTINISKSTNDMLPTALANMRLAALNVQIKSVASKIQETDAKVKEVVSELLATIKTISQSLANVALTFGPIEFVLLDLDHLRCSTIWSAFIDHLHDTIIRFTAKRIEDRKKSAEKQERFQAQKALRERNAAQAVTAKQLTETTARLQQQLNTLKKNNQVRPKNNKGKGKSPNPSAGKGGQGKGQPSNKKAPPKSDGRQKQGGGKNKNKGQNGKGKQRV